MGHRTKSLPPNPPLATRDAPADGTLFSGPTVPSCMADKPSSGELFGIPYNFERPSVRRMLSAYWNPGEGMLVEKPFGVGYTLNLANWRSWIVLAVAGLLVWREREAEADLEADDAADDEEPVEVIVD
jgi:hypothetical protein